MDQIIAQTLNSLHYIGVNESLNRMFTLSLLDPVLNYVKSVNTLRFTTLLHV